MTDATTTHVDLGDRVVLEVMRPALTLPEKLDYCTYTPPEQLSEQTTQKTLGLLHLHTT